MDIGEQAQGPIECGFVVCGQARRLLLGEGGAQSGRCVREPGRIELLFPDAAGEKLRPDWGPRRIQGPDDGLEIDVLAETGKKRVANRRAVGAGEILEGPVQVEEDGADHGRGGGAGAGTSPPANASLRRRSGARSSGFRSLGKAAGANQPSSVVSGSAAVGDPE